jgi:hypothetical protein
VFARTEETVARPGESANTNTEESTPTRAHGGGTAKTFARAAQNELTDASERVSNCPSSRDDLVWLDPPNATPQEHNMWDDMDTDPAAKPHQDTALALPKSSPLVDDDDSASMFTMVRRTRASKDTTVSLPSSEAGEQTGDGSHSEAVAQERGLVEEEELHYRPSPLREKDEEKSPHQEDDVYSLSRLNPPRLSLHKV